MEKERGGGVRLTMKCSNRSVRTNTYGPVACAFTLSFPYHNLKGTWRGNAYKLDDDRNGMRQRLALPTYT
jgi:hypothetical protein